jgi:tRNA 2-thiouridine synthesizing protein B
MAILHTVNKSPFETTTLGSCLDHAAKGDTVLLIEDGVYGAMKGTAAAKEIAAAKGNVSVCVLGPDLAARGIANGKIADGIEVVDYGGFVDLVAAHDVAQAWL